MALRYLARISEIVKMLDHEGDPITYSKQTQNIAQLISEGIQNETEILDLFKLLNKLALASEDVAINLAHLFTARPMATLKFQASQTTIRNEALRILQLNFASEYHR